MANNLTGAYEAVVQVSVRQINGNAKREFVWKYEGAVDPKVLAAALDEHLVPAPAPRSRPLRLAVSPGERAPDVLFKDDRGQSFAVHRFRGRETLILSLTEAYPSGSVTREEGSHSPWSGS